MKLRTAIRKTPLAVIAAACVLLAGCAQGTPGSSTTSSAATGSGTTGGQAPAPSSAQSPAQPAAGTSGSSPAASKKVILIGDQAFGDHGPMDDMAKALDGCAANQGLDTKKVAVLSAADYQSTVGGAATQGYGLIITTFPQMTNATVAVAKAHPNVKFAAVYQYINDQGGANLPNVWDSSFDITASTYVEGAVAASLSKSKKIGMIVGDMDPTIASALNAYIQGAKSVSSDAKVIWANANSFGDPAKGKDLAQGMISKGVDVIATNAAQTQLGALDAAKSAGVLFLGDNGDNSAVYPKGFVSDSRAELGKAVTEACKTYADGTFQAGHHTVYNLKNGGADLDTALITKWGQASGRQAQASQMVALYKKLAADIASGAIKVVNDTNPPKS